MKIDPRHLIQFAAIVEIGGVTDAAVQLGISQPALSKLVTDLEARLGTPLLSRRRKPVLPTPLGRKLAAQGLAIRAAIETAEHAIVGDWRGSKGLVRIGAPSFFCERILPNLILKFWEQFPEVRFELTTAYQAELLNLVEDCKIDFALTPVGTEQFDRTFQNEILLDTEHVVVARSGHPILDLSNVGPETLSSMLWISQMPHSILYEITTRSLQHLGVSKMKTLLKSDSASTIMKVLRSVDCVTVLPTFAILEGLQSGQLGIVQTAILPRIAFGTVYNNTIPLSRVAKNFVSHLKEQLKELSHEAALLPQSQNK